MSTGHVTSAVAVHREEAILFFTLLQLTIVVLAGRVGAALAVRVGQTTVVGEIIVGILLGPSLFGLLAPDTFHFVFRSAPPDPMQVLSQLGLLLLMFQIGLTFDFGHLTERRNRNTVLWVAAVGLVLPFVMGLALGWVMAPYLGGPAGNPLAMALFVATAFSITALPVMGRILMECNMAHRPLGVMAISAAAINDVVGWLLLALVTALSVAQFQATGFALNVLAVLVFIVASWWLIRPPLKRVVRWTQARPDRDGVRSPLPNDLLGILITAIFIGGMTTYKLGIFAIFGGFMLGVLLHDERALVDAWRARMGQFVTVFFLPIFFTYSGLRTHIGGLNTPALWGWCAVVVGLATVGKFCGSYLAARRAGMGKPEAKVLGILMNTRGLMELVVINVGYDLGVISQNLFTMLVLMAIISTVVTTPLLRRWIPQCRADA